MDGALARTVRQAPDDARAKGRDYLTQTKLAVRAGHQARSDPTACDVLAIVRTLQQS